MAFTFYDAIGTLGVGLIVLAYFLLQVGRVDLRSARYSWLNLIGAILIIISLTHTFNLASFIIEVFWIIISLIGLYQVYFGKPGQSD